MLESGSWILLLEAGVALSLLVIIVWATWPKTDHAARPPQTPPGDSQPAPKPSERPDEHV